MTRARHFVGAAMTILLAATPWRADNSTTPQESQPPGRTLLAVTVKDASGRLVEGISQNEFRVLEDGAEQQIEWFSADGAPLSVVVVVDMALAPGTAGNVTSSLGAIAGGLGPADELALFPLNEVGVTPGDFLADNDRILATLKAVEITASATGPSTGPMAAGPRVNTQSQATGVPPAENVPKHTKPIDDAVSAAGQALKARDAERRRIILLVTDGANSSTNRVTFDGTRRTLLEADAALFAVDVSGFALRRGTDRLERYAQASGGEALRARSRTDLEAAYGRFLEQARYAYRLGYTPRGVPAGREYHDVEVRVRRPNLTIQVRTGYYTAVPAAK